MTVAHRQPPAADPHRLQLLDRSVAVHVADEQGQARLAAVLAQERLVKTVATPVGGDDVEPPIVVRVDHRNPVPPAAIPAEAKRVGALDELAGVVAEHPHRPPLGGQGQVGIAVSIEVGLGQAVHPLDRFKRRPPGRDLRVRVVYLPEPPRRVAEKLEPGLPHDGQVLPAVAVGVQPRHARPRLAGSARQQRIVDKIVDRRLIVPMAQP